MTENPLGMKLIVTPKLRTAVEIDGELVLIPYLFWQDVKADDIDMMHSRLSRSQERRLWRMLGRKGHCPRGLKVVVNRQDVESLMNDKDRKQ